MPFPFLLLLALVLPQATPAAPAKDALTLLNEVSQRYADARSYHLEAVEEKTESHELSRHWNKRLLTAIVMPDGRYRYEGNSGFGSATLVSDGTTHWDYHPVDHLYTAQPASPNDPPPRQILAAEEVTVHDAKFLMHRLAHNADSVKSAAFLPDESIPLNGKKVDCYVVHYVDDSVDSDVRFEWTVWIDKVAQGGGQNFQPWRDLCAHHGARTHSKAHGNNGDLPGRRTRPAGARQLI